MDRPDRKRGLQDRREGFFAAFGDVPRLRRCNLIVSLSHTGGVEKQPGILVDRKRRTGLAQHAKGDDTYVPELYD